MSWNLCAYNRPVPTVRYRYHHFRISREQYKKGRHEDVANNEKLLRQYISKPPSYLCPDNIDSIWGIAMPDSSSTREYISIATSAGVDLDLHTHHNPSFDINNAIDISCKSRSFRTVKWLLANGADPNTESSVFELLSGYGLSSSEEWDYPDQIENVAKILKMMIRYGLNYNMMEPDRFMEYAAFIYNKDETKALNYVKDFILKCTSVQPNIKKHYRPMYYQSSTIESSVTIKSIQNVFCIDLSRRLSLNIYVLLLLADES